MVGYISRATIGLRAANGSRSLVASKVKNVAFHYPGMASPINAAGTAGLARVKSALRGWQDYHMKTRGWSDIAYQVAIDQAGRAYTLRGINIQSAANGDQAVNTTYGAVLLVLGNNEEPSSAMLATARAVVADYRKRYPAMPKRPTWHGAIRPGGTASDPSTDCPGKRTIAAIKAGQLDAGAAASTPTTPAIDPNEVFDMAVTVQDLDDVIKKYVVADNNRDAQVLTWQVSAQSYSDARMAELHAQGTSYRDALVKVQQELWGILRPLWEAAS